jgi:hypothetical protein
MLTAQLCIAEEEGNSYKLVLRQASMKLTAWTSVGTHVYGSRFIFMSSGQQRKIYQSDNGDSWWLCREPAGVFVLHEANQPSGGAVTKMDLPQFLTRGADAPEKQALLAMIGELTHCPF